MNQASSPSGSAAALRERLEARIRDEKRLRERYRRKTEELLEGELASFRGRLEALVSSDLESLEAGWLRGLLRLAGWRARWRRLLLAVAAAAFLLGLGCGWAAAMWGVAAGRAASALELEAARRLVPPPAGALPPGGPEGE